MRARNSVLIVLVAAIILSACGAGFAGDQFGSGKNHLKGKRVGLMVKSQTAMFWVIMMNRAAELAKEMGFELEILAPTTPNSNEEQIQLLESSLIDPPDIYVLVPSDSQGILPAIAEIHDAGVPIVNLNTKIGGGAEVVSFVSCEQYGLGVLAIQEAIKRLGDKGNCVFIEGPLGAQTHIDRNQGAKDTIAANPGWTILDRQVANSNRAEALTVMQTLLTKYNNIDFAFVGDADMALGAMEAVNQAGLSGKVKIVNICCDAAICDAIASDKIWMAVDDSPASQVTNAIQVANMHLGGEAVKPTYITDVHIVDKSNVEKQALLYVK